VISPISSGFDTCTNRPTNFTFMWPCIVRNFLIIKPTRCTNFANVFWNETLCVSDSFSVHHQELPGWNCISILILLLESCLQTCMTYTIDVCTVNNSWWWTGELSETCSFISKINLRN
jgi:hypothetical protein